MAPYIAANSWELASPPPDSVTPVSATPSEAAKSSSWQDKTVSIETAVRLYLKEHEQAHSAPNTIRKYGLLLGRMAVVDGKQVYAPGKLQKFADRTGLRNIDEWSPSLVRQLRDSLQVSPLTASKNLGVFKGFFEFCVNNEWLEKNPARIKTLRNRAMTEGEGEERQKSPFSDDEVDRMYDGCQEFGHTLVREWPKKRDGRQVEAITRYRDYNRKWTGTDLADFISVAIYTGLRISDLSTFHISRLKSTGEVHIRTAKGNRKVYTWIPEWLANVIRSRAKRVGPLIFGEHSTTDINVITDVWRRKLKILWEQTGPWMEKPAPHRFRHTFARILLEHGTPVPKVAELMGNTEAIVRKHYAAWVEERQKETTAILQRAFANVPRPDIPRRTKVSSIG
jgi:integrase